MVEAALVRRGVLKMKNSKAALLGSLSLAALILAGPVGAQEVRILSGDGSIDITGTLLSAEGGQLVLSTPIGEITVDQSLVTCQGEACPVVRQADVDFTLSGPADVSEMLVPVLFDGFAARQEGHAEVLDEAGAAVAEADIAGTIRPGSVVPIQVHDETGAVTARVGIREVADGEGFGLLAAGEVELAFSKVAATPADLRNVRDAGGGDLTSFEQEDLVALDGLTIIAHPDNPVPSLTMAELSGILAGEIVNWAEVGGPDAPIGIYAHADASEDVAALLLDPVEKALSAAAKVVASAEELTAAVSADPHGIAVTGFHLRRNARAIPIRDECGAIIAASPFTIKNGEYPLVRQVTAYRHGAASDVANEFAGFLDSPALDGLVAKSGFIDLSIVPEGEAYAAGRIEALRTTPVEPAAQERLAALVPELEQVERLSTTFRFPPKSSVLDNRARRDLIRLVRHVGKTKPSKLYVVGFADRGGSFKVNQRLAQERATQVAAEIAAAATGGELDGVAVEVQAYSELLPVACNETFEGRSINRRVEIWVK